MPRVSFKEQYIRYDMLRTILVSRRSIYSYLSSSEQKTIYAYYQPHKDHLPDSLKAHQRAAAKADPSLPQRAGKAHEALMDAALAFLQAEAERPITPAQRGHVKGPKRKRNIVVRPLVRPEPDLNKLMQVIWSVAEQMAKDAETDHQAA